MSTVKRSRCSNGTRKNKKTGKCESVLRNTCAICLAEVTSGNITTKCKHKFHKRCLIGWCKNSTYDKSTCPVCRKSIQETCVKIMPFNSHEVFRYVNTYNDLSDRPFKQQKLSKFIHHKDFDVNVKNEDGKSILHVLSTNTHNDGAYLIDIDDLLYDPQVEVTTDLVRELMATQNAKTGKVLALFKKHKRIPKALKALM